MDKLKLSLVALTLLAALSINVPYATASVEIQWAIVPPVINGVLEPGEWDEYFWFTDNTKGPGTGYVDDDKPVFHGYIANDLNNLYLAFEVEDNTQNTNRDFLYLTIDIPTAGEFNEPVDALYWGSIPTNPSFFGEAYLTESSFPWDRSQRPSTWDGGVVEVARTITDTTRCYELKVPLSRVAAEPGDSIGLKVQARDGNYPAFQYVNFYPNMPDGITPIRADTRVEFEGNFERVTLAIALPIEIDIKPGSYPNSINLGSKGVLPVAVLSTESFDASTVNPTTVTFASASWVRWTLEDVNGDDRMDLLLHFKTQDLNLDTNSMEATLTGNTYDGTPIKGTDTVNIVPK